VPDHAAIAERAGAGQTLFHVHAHVLSGDLDETSLGG
jgi:histidine triad (HIT) family protein